MEYTCIYEALPNKLLTLPFILISAAALLLAIYSIVNWTNNSTGGKIGMCSAFMILLIIIGSMVYTYCSSYTVWYTYENSECLVAEGVIEDYISGTKTMTTYPEEMQPFPDRFTVSGVDFLVSPTPARGYGYTMRQYDGGVLRNGLHCKIFYVPYKGENVIMKILIEQQTVPQVG